MQAEYEAPSDACRSTTMELNFKTKEFYLITKNAGGNCEVLGQKIDPLKKPRISQIVDGEQIIARENETFRQKTYRMLSSEIRARVESYQKASRTE